MQRGSFSKSRQAPQVGPLFQMLLSAQRPLFPLRMRMRSAAILSRCIAAPAAKRK